MVNYCLNTNDSVIGGVFFDWLETRTYNPDISNDLLYWEDIQQKIKEFDQIVEQKCDEIKQIMIRLTGKQPIEGAELNNHYKYLMWTYHNIIVKLYADGRMAMYMIEE